MSQDTTKVLELGNTDTASVVSEYLAMEHGGRAFKAPLVNDYKDLFKKSPVVEYETDSPAFRNRIDSLVCIL